MSKRLQNKNITIKGTEFVVYPFAGRKSLEILEKISKSIIPIFSAYLDRSEPSSNSNEIEHCIQSAYSSLGIDKAYPFIMEILSDTKINDNGNAKEINDSVFDNEFCGNLKSLFLLIKFILADVNYSDFFGEGGIGLAMAKAKANAEAKAKAKAKA